MKDTRQTLSPLEIRPNCSILQRSVADKYPNALVDIGEVGGVLADLSSTLGLEHSSQIIETLELQPRQYVVSRCVRPEQGTDLLWIE